MFAVFLLLTIMLSSTSDTVRIIRKDYNGSVLKSAIDGGAYDGSVEVVFGDTCIGLESECRITIVGFANYGFDFKRTPRPGLVDSLRAEAAAVGADLLVLDADIETIERQMYGPNVSKPEGAALPGRNLPRVLFAAFARVDRDGCREVRSEPSLFMSRELAELEGEIAALALVDRDAGADTSSLIRMAILSAGVVQHDLQEFGKRQLAETSRSRLASESERASWRQELINDSWAAILEAEDALVVLSRAVAASDGGWITYRLGRLQDIVEEIQDQLRANLEYAFSIAVWHAPEAVR